MEITPKPTPAATATAATKPAEKQDEGAVSANEMAGDFETFLKLLTTQLRNQDPLKPMESTEFVAQLASFSAVEQQVRANDRLDRIVEVLGSGSHDGLAQWIGKEVRAPGKAAYDGVPVEVEVTPFEGAEKAVLVVRNDFDQVIARQPVAVEETHPVWDGKNAQGDSAPLGRYSFALESYAKDEVVDTQAGRVYAEVTEVRFEDGAPVLLTDGGAQVSIEEIDAIR
jgi:flagellar basal-body rod modification protein FlgD